MIEGSIQEENITIINMYALNIGGSQYIRLMLTTIKGEINSNTIIVGDFNTLFTPTDRSSNQIVNKETQVLNDTLDQLDLIDTYRAFHPKTTHFTFFSSAYGTLFRTNHILHHKSSLGKFLKSEIISSIFYDHNSIRLHINYRKKKKKKNYKKHKQMEDKQHASEKQTDH